jgi:hypothetical protein
VGFGQVMLTVGQDLVVDVGGCPDMPRPDGTNMQNGRYEA